MSPAMVENRAPASIQTKPKRFPSRNPRKGQIFPSRPPLPFDQSDIPTQEPSFRSMDRSDFKLGQDGGAFPSPFPPVSSSGKPSKPRFLKVRRNSNSSRSKPFAVQDAAAELNFNPFRSEKSPFVPEPGPRVSENSDSLNSAAFGNADSVLNSNSRIAAAFSFGSEGSADFGMGGFVFGTDGKSGPNLSRSSSQNSTGPNLSRNSSQNSTFPNVGSFGTGKSESAEFVFGDSSASRSKPIDIGLGKQAGIGHFDSGYFTNLSKNSSLASDSALPPELNLKSSGNGDSFQKTQQDEMERLNIGREAVSSFESVKSGSSEFVFGSSWASGLEPVGLGKPSGSGGSDPGVRLFGNSVMKSANLSQNSSTGTGDGSFSQLPDKMRKLNLKKSGNGDCFGKSMQADYVSNLGSNKSAPGFVGGNTVNKLPEQMEKLNIGKEAVGSFESVNADSAEVIFGSSRMAGSKPIETASGKLSYSGDSDPGIFNFRSSMTKGTNVSQNSSLGFDEGSFFELPDEIRKLNLKKAGNGDGFEKTKQANYVFSHKDNKSAPDLVGSSTVNVLPEQMEKLNIGREYVGGSESVKSGSSEFVFGPSFVSGSKSINTGPVKPSVRRNSDEVLLVFRCNATNLSQNSSSGSDEGSFSKLSGEIRKLHLEKSGKEASFEKTKQDDYVSNVGDNKNAPGVVGGNTVNKLPEEMEKLNIGKEAKPQSKNNFSADSAPGLPAYERSTRKTSVSSEMPATSFTGSSKKNMASECPAVKNMSNSDSIEMAKEGGCGQKMGVNNGFVFGSMDNGSSSFGGNAATFHDDAEKVKTGSTTKNLVGSTPCNATFQSGTQGHNSGMGFIPPYQAPVAPPFHPSTPGPIFKEVEPGFAFAIKNGGLEMPHMEFRTLKQDAARLTKENLFTGRHQNMPFGVKKGESRGTRTKKNKGKYRQSKRVHQSFSENFVSMEGDSQENPEVESTGGYSPMDYSPYQEVVVTDQCSREASVASDDSICFVSRSTSTDTQRSVPIDDREELLVSAAERLDINEGNQNQEHQGESGSKDHVQGSSTADSSFAREQTSGVGKACGLANDENLSLHSETETVPMELKTGSFSSNIERQASQDGTGFIFSSSIEDSGGSNFAFGASPFIQGPLSGPRQSTRWKRRTKAGHDTYFSAPNAKGTSAIPSSNLFPLSSSTVPPDSVQGQKGISSVPQNEEDSRAGKSKKPEASQESIAPTAACVAALEVCEKWRNRGNQAYANGHLSKAEDYYTRGVNSVHLKGTSGGCIAPLTLCYSNRAATRMRLGKMREALSDCKMAVKIDPNFVRAKVRTAKCHLALGEVGEALKHFKKCLQTDKDIKSDQKILIEASDGLQKAQQVADLTGQSAELLLRRSSTDATKALEIISEALSISPHSESLLEMKAEALLMMRKYEEVIQLCEHTLDLAERNSVGIEDDLQFGSADSSGHMKTSSVRFWRWRLISKSYFYLGKLEEALELLQKQEQVKPAEDKSPESSTSLAVTVRELLRLKAAGNEAFQASRHSEAVEYYTAALACTVESRPFAAVCFCNRAAAYQALGQITDAIADCSLAIAFDASYPKAISRRATLHEMIRDYGQATSDLRRLISLLEKQLEEKDNQLGVSGRSSSINDLKRARARLATVEEETRKGASLDMYKILGIEPSSSAADIKKAYRKAALRHHPDKAGPFLARNENVDDVLWREVAGQVHTDADRLFKMIGEAYTILSDPTKRLQYDAEEELKSSLKKGYNGSSTPKTSADNYSDQYERSSYRRQWRAHGSSYQRW